MTLYLNLIELLLVNILIGIPLYLREGFKKKELWVLLGVSLVSILFSAVLIYLWNLTLVTGELTIEGDAICNGLLVQAHIAFSL